MVEVVEIVDVLDSGTDSDETAEGSTGGIEVAISSREGSMLWQLHK